MPGFGNEFRTESMNFEGHLCNASTKQYIQVKDTWEKKHIKNTHEFDAFLKIQQQVCPRICHVYTCTCIYSILVYTIKPTWIHPHPPIRKSPCSQILHPSTTSQKGDKKTTGNKKSSPQHRKSPRSCKQMLWSSSMVKGAWRSMANCSASGCGCIQGWGALGRRMGKV